MTKTEYNRIMFALDNVEERGERRRNKKMKKYKVREKSIAALFVNIWNSKKEIAEIIGFLFMLFAFSFGAHCLCALIN